MHRNIEGHKFKVYFSIHDVKSNIRCKFCHHVVVSGVSFVFWQCNFRDCTSITSPVSKACWWNEPAFRFYYSTLIWMVNLRRHLYLLFSPSINSRVPCHQKILCSPKCLQGGCLWNKSLPLLCRYRCCQKYWNIDTYQFWIFETIWILIFHSIDTCTSCAFKFDCRLTHAVLQCPHKPTSSHSSDYSQVNQLTCSCA